MTPAVTKRDPRGNETLPRSEKETLGEKPEKESAAEKPTAVTAKHPAIQAFKSNAHRYPPKTLYQEIADTVGEDPQDVEFWGQVVYGWIRVGWRPTHYEGMLERYRNRDIPTTVNGKQARPGSNRSNIDASMAAANQVIREYQEAQDDEP